MGKEDWKLDLAPIPYFCVSESQLAENPVLTSRLGRPFCRDGEAEGACAGHGGLYQSSGRLICVVAHFVEAKVPCITTSSLDLKLVSNEYRQIEVIVI